jgi:hypothetical protein
MASGESVVGPGRLELPTHGLKVTVSGVLRPEIDHLIAKASDSKTAGKLQGKRRLNGRFWRVRHKQSAVSQGVCGT